MKDATANTVRAAWYGPLTADQVAAKFRMSARAVRAFWRDEIDAGRLPVTPRPYFVKFQPKEHPPLPPAEPVTLGWPPAPPPPATIVHAYPDDGAGVVDLKADDQLLARLRAAHGNDVRRQVEVRIAETLDRSDASHRHKPPRAEIARMVRGLDHFMRGATQHTKERRT